jgi:hypothetical protein
VKQLFLLGVSLISVWACTPPPPRPAPQPAAAVPVTPTTTNAFDGMYTNAVVTAKTAACPNLNPPTLTITNGSALWQGPNLAFQGYVSPQGVLVMSSSTGQTFQGQIDPQFMLRARVAGPNCAYDITWNRVS